MSKNAHYNPKSAKWVISLAIMIVLSVGVVAGSVAVNKAALEKRSQPVEITYTIKSTQAMSVKDNDLGVTGVSAAYDESNNIVAYIIEGEVIGYNQEVPIQMATTISADGELVSGVEIIKQEETEYLGVRICEEGFRNQFAGRRLPVVSSNSLEKGSRVDVIARSTISSEAVIKGVSNAQEYVKGNILK